MDSAKILTGAGALRTRSKSVYGTTYAPVDGTGIGIAVIDSGVGLGLSDNEFDAADGNSRVAHFKDFSTRY